MSNVFQFVPFKEGREVCAPPEFSSLEIQTFPVFSDALYDRKIYPGDWLVCHKDGLLSHGCFVCVKLLKEEGYLTRLLHVGPGGKFTFAAANISHPPIPFDPALHKIVGPAVALCSCHSGRNVCVDLRRNLVPASAVYEWDADSNGFLTSITPWLSETTGIAQENLLQWGFLSSIHIDDSPALTEAYGHALNDKRAYSIQCRIYKVGGGYKWVEGAAMPYFNTSGEVEMWHGYGIDLSVEMDKYPWVDKSLQVTFAASA